MTPDRADYVAGALDRAVNWVADHAPANGPTLGERERLCRCGRPLTWRGDRRWCRTCSNARQRERRKR